MAHVLTIIPKGFRAGKRLKILSCLNDSKNTMQQRLDCAVKAKQKLEADIFERESTIKQSVIN